MCLQQAAATTGVQPGARKVGGVCLLARAVHRTRTCLHSSAALLAAGGAVVAHSRLLLLPDCTPTTRKQEDYDVYLAEQQPLNEGEEKHIISVFVADESGLINRVAGVFARRGGCGLGWQGGPGAVWLPGATVEVMRDAPGRQRCQRAD